MADQVSALEPGLYRATVRGVADQTVMIREDGTGATATYVTGPGVRYRMHDASDIIDARPLIVLDLGAFVTDAMLISHLRATREWDLQQIADQIEAQIKPARIPEPRHVGASVKAGSDDGLDVARPWTRFSTILLANWIDADGRKRCWDVLIDPTLIREGVES